MVKNSSCELVCGRRSAHVACSCLSFGDDTVDGLADSVGVVVKTKVTEEHGAGKNESSWVGLVLALDIKLFDG